MNRITKTLAILVLLLLLAAGAWAAISKAVPAFGWSAGHAQLRTVTLNYVTGEAVAVYGVYKDSAALAAGEQPAKILVVEVDISSGGAATQAASIRSLVDTYTLNNAPWASGGSSASETAWPEDAP